MSASMAATSLSESPAATSVPPLDRRHDESDPAADRSTTRAPIDGDAFGEEQPAAMMHAYNTETPWT